MNKKILDEIKDKKIINAQQLAKNLNMPLQDVQHTLEQLTEEYEVCLVKNQKYTLAGTQGLYKGILECKQAGFAFLRTPDDIDDIFVAPTNKGGAFNNEMVLVKLDTHKTDGKSMEGKVIKVLSPLPVETVGTAQVKGKTVFVVSDEVGVPDIYIPKSKSKGALDRQKVVVNITRRQSQNKSPEGEIVEVLGDSKDSAVEILAYARRFGLNADFDEECSKQAKKLEKEELDLSDRIDLRKELIFTIDGDDAKDLDDAVSLKKLKNGNVELGVHIADVSHYVRYQTPLDKEALKRGTSVYMVDRVVPMLPKELSNNLCSLNPHTDKLTLSCLMEIDDKGEVVKHRVEKTVINSSYRLTYNGVNKVLADHCAKEYKKIKKTLFKMNDLAKQLRQRRNERGSIDFDIDEASIILDDKGAPIDVKVRERGDAEKLIEEFMLKANITVAEQCFHMEIPFLYRVHEQPDADKMKELAIFLSNFGIKLKGSENITPHAIQEVLTQVEDTPQSCIVNTVTLRALKKARYATEPIAHFGLAADQYCHFTSPIRRYPDLQVHRILKSIIAGKLTAKNIAHLEEILPEVAKQTSAKERNAIEAERAVSDLKMTEYMVKHIGETFDGVVSGVTKFGIFVELSNTIEGMIPLAQMKDDYYIYDEKNYCVIGEHTKKRITLGDKTTIKVVSTDVSAGRIEFAFA
ncbi:MAG: ribonuclease R [Christensenellaceae bacterium]